MNKQFWFSLFSLCLVVMYASGAREMFIPDAQSTEAPALLQFTSGGQALGFAKEAVYVTNGSYAYRVEFVNTTPTMPVSDSTQSDAARAARLSSVTYPGLWAGVTLTYDAPEGSILRSSYELEPQADPDAIRLRYNAPALIENDGTLTLSYEAGAMRESAPIAWQEIGGTRVPIRIAFTIRHPPSVENETETPSNRNQEVGFVVGAYDPAYPLFIDPMLTWNTFLGGSGWVVGNAMTIDGYGNIYVAGTSDVSWGLPVSPHSGKYDAFVAKLNNSGGLIWNTFLGGNGIDYGRAIAVDGSGNVYVAGESTATWGAGECIGCPIRAYTASFDAFAAKLNSSGVLTWNTFLGKNGSDHGNAITEDGGGNVYVAGQSTATWGLGECVGCPIRPFTNYGDIFTAKLNSGGALTWNTFLGGSEDDNGSDLAVDGGGSIYLVGISNATWGMPLSPHSGGYDALIAKLDGSGGLTWNTFLGGSGDDYGRALAVDGGGSIYASGDSTATWGTGECTGCPIRAYTGNFDAFAAKLNSSGGLIWNTFLGGSGDDWGSAIVVHGSGNVYVAGSSNATWGSPLHLYSEEGDAFAAKLDSSGGLTWNTFLGGSEGDQGIAIALDGGGNPVVAGTSDATWGSPILPHSGGKEAFAAKLTSLGGLTWNTFFGESAEDVANAIAVDGSGNVYVAGTSESYWGAYLQSHLGGLDAFAAKLNSSGGLTWNTFLGGTADDLGNAITVDGSGKVYVAGISYATWGSPVRTFKGNVDAFAAQLNGSGGLTWNTFLGGSGFDRGWSIAVDGSGNVYVAGDSDVSWQGTNPPIRGYIGSGDAFAARLNSSNGALAWNTFLGGSGGDEGRAIDVNGSSVYVAGTSMATWGTCDCIGCPIRDYTNNGDAFAAKISSSGALTWNTFLGGDGADWGIAIVSDGNDKLYVAGRSDATWGSPVRDYINGSDAFVARLTNGALTWNTFLGGGGDDQGSAIAVDECGNVFVAGSSHATWGSPFRSYTDSADAFAARVTSNNGKLNWNTFLGGNGDDDGYAIAVDAPINVYVAGRSDETWGSPVRAYTADWDAFVSRLSNNIYLPMIKKQ